VLGVLNIDLAKRVIHWLDAGRFKALPAVSECFEPLRAIAQ
jgi:hypothetical protein